MLEGQYVEATDRKLPLRWMAQEAIRRKAFNEKTDVYSFGVLVRKCNAVPRSRACTASA
jgi:hypothetical protein